MSKPGFIAFLLWTLTLNGQTKIQPLKFEFSYSGCDAVDSQLDLPVLETTDPYDVRHTVNNWVKRMYAGQLTEIPAAPALEDCHHCKSIPSHKEIWEMKYSVESNTRRLLSIVIMTSQFRGKGLFINAKPFNMDLQNNQLITIDSLFSTKNKIHLLELAETYIDSAYGKGYFKRSYPGNIYFEGLSIGNNGLTAYYNIHHDPELFTCMPILIPQSEIQPFVESKYQWIFGDR